jgi:hypothetical protein
MDAAYLVTIATAAGAVRAHHVIATSSADGVKKVRDRYAGRTITIRVVTQLDSHELARRES